MFPKKSAQSSRSPKERANMVLTGHATTSPPESLRHLRDKISAAINTAVEIQIEKQENLEEENKNLKVQIENFKRNKDLLIKELQSFQVLPGQAINTYNARENSVEALNIRDVWTVLGLAIKEGHETAQRLHNINKRLDSDEFKHPFRVGNDDEYLEDGV